MTRWPFGLLALAALLAGCSHPVKQRAAVPVYSVDFRGPAKTCTVPKDLSLAPNKPTEAAISVANDGGWCGVTVSQSDDKPYDVGMVTTRPVHGKLFVHTVGGDTRIDYTPEVGFAGADAYAVRLVPGPVALSVKVTVTPAK